MYDAYYDILQPFFCHENLHSYNMGCDSFVLSIKANDRKKDLKNKQK